MHPLNEPYSHLGTQLVSPYGGDDGSFQTSKMAAATFLDMVAWRVTLLSNRHDTGLLFLSPQHGSRCFRSPEPRWLWVMAAATSNAQSLEGSSGPKKASHVPLLLFTTQVPNNCSNWKILNTPPWTLRLSPNSPWTFAQVLMIYVYHTPGKIVILIR